MGGQQNGFPLDQKTRFIFNIDQLFNFNFSFTGKHGLTTDAGGYCLDIVNAYLAAAGALNCIRMQLTQMLIWQSCVVACFKADGCGVAYIYFCLKV